MTAKDFYFDGQYLSDYGCMICQIEQNNDGTVNAGSKITFNKVKRNGGKRYSLSSASYDECFTTSFEICKNPDEFDDMEITNDEYRDLMRWLNRREFLQFYFVEDDGETTYYNCSFDVEKIIYNDKMIGLHLTMTTDSPFGYGQEMKARMIINDVEREYNFTDISDEIGFTYPDMVIKINKDGNLCVKNLTTDCSMVINNCVVGETITIHGDTRIVETDNNNHAKTLYNDFNFEFFNIGNTIDNRLNKIMATLPCTVELSYYPVIK